MEDSILVHKHFLLLEGGAGWDFVLDAIRQCCARNKVGLEEVCDPACVKELMQEDLSKAEIAQLTSAAIEAEFSPMDRAYILESLDDLNEFSKKMYRGALYHSLGKAKRNYLLALYRQKNKLL